MQELCDLKVLVNGQHTFLLNQKIISTFSGKLKKMIKQEKKKTQIKGSVIKINGFPGGPNGFELVSRFCYNKGKIPLSPSNISLLHCSAIFLEMTEEITTCNLLHQTETFLEGLFYWTWNDILTSLKASDSFISYADLSGLLEKLINSLLVKISANSDITFTPSSSSSSSPETPSDFKFSPSTKTPDIIKPCSSRTWWFDDLTILPPKIIEKVAKIMGSFGIDNNSLILTKFLLHYLKTAVQRPGGIGSRSEYGGLADYAVNGVISVGKVGFSCRGLFWVMRVVCGLGLSKDCMTQLERLIGGMLDQATLDDLLVLGHDGAVYDVNLVLRLVRVFVNEDDGMCSEKMKKGGRLIDKYMREISPDQSLKVSKFLAVAESLPDSARDCFDESHPALNPEERTRLCRCLNYEKLTLEGCKDLAKNPRIPPSIAIEALLSQQSKHQSKNSILESPNSTETRSISYGGEEEHERWSEFSSEKEEMRVKLERMQCRVIELEKVCQEMKGQMSKIVKNKVYSRPALTRAMPKLC
ncbi:BTB/POZ domain-containing protein At3g19850-like isoform X2 [Tasmannia lanceolata]|uniref:BTB/POZ domain-containing protein At3g19850-like isoform X2 n=1 Tax=Tasmannia lanceolata TaxID=3420 RepID=UPI004063295D